MITNHTGNETMTTFGRLKAGDIFEYHKTLYMKIKFFGEEINAVNLELGIIRTFSENEPVNLKHFVIVEEKNK